MIPRCSKAFLSCFIVVLSCAFTMNANADDLTASVKNFNAAIEDIIHADEALFSLGGQDVYYDHQDDSSLKMPIEDHWSLRFNPGKGEKSLSSQGQRWINDDYYGSFRLGIGLEYEFSY